MKFLALDTATEACSAALFVDGMITEQFKVAPREHANLILPMTESLLTAAGLKPADLDAIAFGCGPGAFTGVRIAAGVVQGIAFAASLPVVPVSNLAAVALAASRETDAEHLLICFDARMREVYWGQYATATKTSSVILLDQERLSSPDDVMVNETVYGAGSGWSAYPVLQERLASKLVGINATLLPHAADIARLAAPRIEQGDTVPAEQALPVYLRDEVAWKKN